MSKRGSLGEFSQSLGQFKHSPVKGSHDINVSNSNQQNANSNGNFQNANFNHHHFSNNMNGSRKKIRPQTAQGLRRIYTQQGNNINFASESPISNKQLTSQLSHQYSQASTLSEKKVKMMAGKYGHNANFGQDKNFHRRDSRQIYPDPQTNGNSTIKSTGSRRGSTMGSHGHPVPSQSGKGLQIYREGNYAQEPEWNPNLSVDKFDTRYDDTYNSQNMSNSQSGQNMNHTSNSRNSRPRTLLDYDHEEELALRKRREEDETQLAINMSRFLLPPQFRPREMQLNWGHGNRFRQVITYGSATPGGNQYYKYSSNLQKARPKSSVGYRDTMRKTPSFGIGPRPGSATTKLEIRGRKVQPPMYDVRMELGKGARTTNFKQQMGRPSSAGPTVKRDMPGPGEYPLPSAFDPPRGRYISPNLRPKSSYGKLQRNFSDQQKMNWTFHEDQLGGSRSQDHFLSVSEARVNATI